MSLKLCAAYLWVFGMAGYGRVVRRVDHTLKGSGIVRGVVDPKGGVSKYEAPQHKKGSILQFCSGLGKIPHVAHKPFKPEDPELMAIWKTFEHDYVLNSTMLELGSIRGNVRRLQSMLEKLAKNETVRVITFGNSFMAGHGCGETPEQNQLDCTWPKRAEHWMQTAFPSSSVHWDNQAQSGVGSKAHLSMIGTFAQHLEHQPDLIVLDFVLSDMKDHGKLQEAHEKMIRVLWNLFPKTQLLLVEDGCKRCIAKDGSMERRREIARHYGIPVLDYAALVENFNRKETDGPDRLWPFTRMPRAKHVLGATWPNLVPKQQITHVTAYTDMHPPWTVHQYYADAVAHKITEMLQDACQDQGTAMLQLPAPLPAPLASQELLDTMPVCLSPLSSYNTSYRQTEPHLGGDWSIREDVLGRPGWISEHQGSVIEFPVRLGMHPTLVLTFLKSYEGLGSADMSLKHVDSASAHKKNRALDRLFGLWDDHFSMPFTHSWLAHHDSMGMATDVSDIANKTMLLQIKNVNDKKFKLLSVSSC